MLKTNIEIKFKHCRQFFFSNLNAKFTFSFRIFWTIDFLFSKLNSAFTLICYYQRVFAMFSQIYYLREKIINFFNIATKTNQKFKNVSFDHFIIWIFITNFDSCDSSTNALVKKLRDVEFDYFAAYFSSNQHINNEINDVIDFAKINKNLNLISFDYLQMFCIYSNVKIFLFFIIITFLKTNQMRIFVMIIFFQTFHASHANENAKILRHQCKTRRKIFDIIRFFKNKNNYNEKLTRRICYEYKMLQNIWQNEILTEKIW